MSAKRWSQRAVIAARLRPFYDAKARERMEAGRPKQGQEKIPEVKQQARDAAGKAANVNGKRWRYVILALLVGIGAGLLMERGRPRPAPPLLLDLPRLDAPASREWKTCVV